MSNFLLDLEETVALYGEIERKQDEEEEGGDENPECGPWARRGG